MKTIEFSDLEKRLRRRSWRELLTPPDSLVSVVAISRDGCPGCVTLKPALAKLARALTAKHGHRLAFTAVHISCPGGSREESLRSKKALGHYFYPAIVILMRSPDLGPVEFSRTSSPSIPFLNKQISQALRAALSLKP